MPNSFLTLFFLLSQVNGLYTTYVNRTLSVGGSSTSVLKLLPHKVGMFYSNTVYKKCKYKLDATEIFKMIEPIYISYFNSLCQDSSQNCEKWDGATPISKRKINSSNLKNIFLKLFLSLFLNGGCSFYLPPTFLTGPQSKLCEEA